MNDTPQTFTYKEADGCAIRADVYPSGRGDPHPAIVWIHGGALMAGGRWVSEKYRALYGGAGYTLVSIDYRLAPETKMAGIVEDIVDAFRWVRSECPSRFGIDPDRLAAIGHSAGGCLALLAGVHVEPKPKAIVSFYGYGDVGGDWYAKPDPYYCAQPAISEEEARAQVGGAPVSNGGETGRKRIRFYHYCRQHGIWPQEVVGHDPLTEPEAFDAYCSVRNVTPQFPPALLLHGDKDHDVPYKLSVMMADELKKHGVEHELITIEGGDHGFDHGLEGDEADRVFGKVLSFLAAHLGA